LHRLPAEAAVVGLFLDFETFGEHQGRDTGIFEFMRHLPRFVLTDERFEFATPAEAASRHPAIAQLDVPDPVSWADAGRDLSAWLGNPMQRAAHGAIYELWPAVDAASSRGRPELLECWRRLTTSDHVYYMATAALRSDGEVHEYFSPYGSAYQAFANYMNVVEPFRAVLRSALRTIAPPTRSQP
jgi:alpha-amylase